MSEKVRTFRRDADPSVFIRAKITNSEDDLTDATVEMGYAPAHGGYPDEMTAADETTHPDEHTIIASKMITDLVPVGEYMLWVRIANAPQQVPLPAGPFNVI